MGDILSSRPGFLHPGIGFTRMMLVIGITLAVHGCTSVNGVISADFPGSNDISDAVSKHTLFQPAELRSASHTAIRRQLLDQKTSKADPKLKDSATSPLPEKLNDISPTPGATNSKPEVTSTSAQKPATSSTQAATGAGSTTLRGNTSVSTPVAEPKAREELNSAATVSIAEAVAQAYATAAAANNVGQSDATTAASASQVTTTADVSGIAGAVAGRPFLSARRPDALANVAADQRTASQMRGFLTRAKAAEIASSAAQTAAANGNKQPDLLYKEILSVLLDPKRKFVSMPYSGGKPGTASVGSAVNATTASDGHAAVPGSVPSASPAKEQVPPPVVNGSTAASPAIVPPPVYGGNVTEKARG